MKKNQLQFTLVIVFISVLAQTLFGQTDILPLKSDTIQNPGDEILHTPYRVVNRSLYTGSISTMKGSDVENNPILFRTNSMAGMLGGVTINQRMGTPGLEFADVFLRGLRVNQLLIDGVLVDPNNLSAMGPLDPYDIESISVLKDAMSTSAYGIRGGRGIINITTKRGYVGKPLVSVNTQTGFKANTVPLNSVNSYEYVTAVNLWDRNLGKSPDQFTYSPEVVAKYKDIVENGYDDINNPLDRYLYPNNNYEDLFLKDFTLQSRTNVNIRGGNEIAQYFLSTNYIYNTGAYKVDKDNPYNTNSSYDFIGIRSNVDINATKSLLVRLDITAQQDKRNTPGFQVGVKGGNVADGESDAANANVYENIKMSPPNAYPIFNPDGSLGTYDGPYRNPYGLINESGYSFNLKRSMFGRLTLKQELDDLLKGLSLMGGVNFSNQFEMRVNRSKQFQGFKIDMTSIGANHPDSLRYIGENTTPSIMNNNPPSFGQLYNLLNFDVGMDYNRRFGKHATSAFVRANNQTIDFKDTELQRVFRGIRGGVSYVYDNKYVAEATYALEATERLPDHKKYVPFHAYGLGWVVSNEEFLHNSNLISFLKLSYNRGKAGHDNIPYFEFLPKYQESSRINPQRALNWLWLGYNPTPYPDYMEVMMPSMNIVPEMLSTDNLRLDMSLFNNRITASMDLWQREQYNVRIRALDVPLSVGSDFPLVPEGIRKYKGYEFELGYSGQVGDFRFRVSGIAHQFSSEMIKDDQSVQLYDYQITQGLPVGASFGYVILGYFRNQEEIDIWPTYSFATPKPGDLKVKDINGDGVIDNYDMVYKGRNNGVPEMQYGVNVSLDFKGIDFSVLFQGQYGGDAKRTKDNWGFTEFSEGGLGTVYRHHLNSFVPDDPSTWEDATWHLLYSDNPVARVFQNDYSRVDYSYLRIKSLELGYSFSPRVLNSIRIDRLRVYFSGYNLFTWGDDFWGYDIESPSDGRNVLIQKIYNFGLNVTF